MFLRVMRNRVKHYIILSARDIGDQLKKQNGKEKLNASDRFLFQMIQNPILAKFCYLG